VLQSVQTECLPASAAEFRFSDFLSYKKFIRYNSIIIEKSFADLGQLKDLISLRVSEISDKECRIDSISLLSIFKLVQYFDFGFKGSVF